MNDKIIDDLSGLNNNELIKIIRHLQEYTGLSWHDYPEEIDALCKSISPSLKEDKSRELKSCGTGSAVNNILELTDHPVSHWLIEGENLYVLHALLADYLAKIDITYIDPPYNTGNKDLKYNDSRDAGWLSFMYYRLTIAHKLLNDNGVIFISIDDNKQAYLKLLCDKIFGTENFVATIVWKCRTGANDVTSNISTDHEYIIVYTKDPNNFSFHGVRKDLSNYTNPDDDPNGPWMRDNPSAASGSEVNRFPIINPHTKEIYKPPTGRYWAFSEKRISEWHNSGKLVFPKENNKSFTLKKYRNELRSDFKPLSTFIDGYLTKHGTNELQNILGYKSIKYPKPLGLISELLRQCRNKEAIILDFFAGSGTTGHAVLCLNREDGGHRKFILCTNNEDNICTDVCYPRITKAMKGYRKLNGEYVEGLGGSLKYFRC